jgi:23S rRNA maturation-related 3'-5' exoribonuclease YhaM
MKTTLLKWGVSCILFFSCVSVHSQQMITISQNAAMTQNVATLEGKAGVVFVANSDDMVITTNINKDPQSPKAVKNGKVYRYEMVLDISGTKARYFTVTKYGTTNSQKTGKIMLSANMYKYLQDKELQKIVKYLVNKFHDKYVVHPAAVRNHHNFASGLLYHSICMADMAEQVCKLYPKLNRDWVVGGALIHDLGKTIELSGPIATKYTVEGNLVGHISIMVAEIRMAAKELGIEGEKLTLLEHMIASHHSKPEFGSPIPPLTREALALAMIDDFDAKMNIVDKAVENADLESFTEKIFALDGRAYYVPSYEKKNR